MKCLDVHRKLILPTPCVVGEGSQFKKNKNSRNWMNCLYWHTKVMFSTTPTFHGGGMGKGDLQNICEEMNEMSRFTQKGHGCQPSSPLSGGNLHKKYSELNEMFRSLWKTHACQAVPQWGVRLGANLPKLFF